MAPGTAAVIKKAASNAAVVTETFAQVMVVFIGWFGFAVISPDRLSDVKTARMQVHERA